MNMAVVTPLITAGVGLVVGLVPFAYTVFKDRRERIEQHKREEAERHEQDQERRRLEVEEQRERQRIVATSCLALLGQTMSLLEAIRVDADNADELLRVASESFAHLQGVIQGNLIVTFKEASPVVWAARACSRLVAEGLRQAEEARGQHQTGQAALETQRAIRHLTSEYIDPVGGPRDLLRWATEEAIRRGPERLTSFEQGWQSVAQIIAGRAGLELPAALISPNC